MSDRYVLVGGSGEIIEVVGDRVIHARDQTVVDGGPDQAGRQGLDHRRGLPAPVGGQAHRVALQHDCFVLDDKKAADVLIPYQVVDPPLLTVVLVGDVQ